MTSEVMRVSSKINSFVTPINEAVKCSVYKIVVNGAFPVVRRNTPEQERKSTYKL